jgi:uncharacterized repeat protein (TIGR01451 family)
VAIFAALFLLPGTASATVTTQDLTVTPTSTPTMARAYTWSILKSVSGEDSQTAAAGTTVGFDYAIAVTKSAPTDSAWALSGTIAVKNPNGFSIGATITDDVIGTTADTCTIAGGAQRDIAAATTTTFTYSCTFSSKPSYAALTDTASVTWIKTNYKVTQSGNSIFQFGTGSAGNPTLTGDQIHVFDTFNHGSTDSVGTTSSSYTYKVHYGIVVPSGTSGCTPVDNTASFTPGNYGNSPSNTSSVTTQVCVTPKDLTITKTATPAFTRTYTWAASKSVDQTTITTANDTATANYTVVATKSAPTDSGWIVTGSISVNNPNSYPMMNVVVSEQGVTNGGVCILSNSGQIGTLAATSSVSVPYTCSYAAAPSPAAGTNTANVTWQMPEAGSVPGAKGSASVTTPFVFAVPTTVLHDSANVTDLFDSGAATPIAGGTDINATTTFTYSRTLTVPATGCQVYDNTAAVVPTDSGAASTATAQVTVCRAVPPVTPPATPVPPVTPPVTTSVPPVTPPVHTATKTSTPPSKTTVSLKKHADASTVKAGGIVSFTIIYKNTGKASAKHVVICDDLPNQMSFVSASGATFKNGKACWKRTFVHKGATLTFRVVARVNANAGGAKIVNVATATASNAKPATAKAPVRALRNQRVRAGGVTG